MSAFNYFMSIVVMIIIFVCLSQLIKLIIRISKNSSNITDSLIGVIIYTIGIGGFIHALIRLTKPLWSKIISHF